MDTQQIWKLLGEDRRILAASSFYNDASMKEFHRIADGFIANQKHFRPQFVKKLPVEKRTSYLANLPLPPDMSAQLIVAYHFAVQRPLMSAFLSALNIPNENGQITENHEVSTPTAEALAAAVAIVSAQYPAEDVQIYFSTLISQNPEVWDGLTNHLTI